MLSFNCPVWLILENFTKGSFLAHSSLSRSAGPDPQRTNFFYFQKYDPQRMSESIVPRLLWLEHLVYQVGRLASGNKVVSAGS